MYKKNSLLFLFGIMALASCYHIGRDCDPCPEDPTNTPPPPITEGSHINPSGCELFTAAHPRYPEETDPAYDVIYTFCDDHTVRKQWNADPQLPVPGPTDGTGTWAYDGDQLTIIHTNVLMGGAVSQTTTEVYDVAFAYDDGAKIDLYSAQKVPAGDGISVLGNYERHVFTQSVMTGMFNATIDSYVDTVITVTDGAWTSSQQESSTCTGDEMICNNVPPDGPPTVTSGTFIMPGSLFAVGGSYVFQTSAGKALVLERSEVDPCKGVDCGDHGSLVDEACVCTDGYTGLYCEIPPLSCPEDTDGDGYGSPASGECTYPEPDCDDNRTSVYPGAPELCDGIDNQCSGDVGYGSIDEGYTACGAMARIAAGCFDMGDHFAEGDPVELPVHNVCLSAFEMDFHQVTNAEYAECVSAGACTVPSNLGSDSRATYYGDPAYADFPVIFVTWYQAEKYCTWAGKKLPIEAQWEYAARGGLPGKRYFWGDTDPTGAECNFFNSGDPWDNDTSEVEHYPANGYGLFDMAGNVWEYMADRFNPDYYAGSPSNDPQGPTCGTNRVLRGCSWGCNTNYALRVALRDLGSPVAGAKYVGFRCAR